MKRSTTRAGLLCSALALPFAFALALATPAAADDYPRDPNVDVLHYAFRLTLHDDTDRIDGVATITVRFAAAGVTAVGLDLVGREANDGSGMVVTSVTDDAGHDAAFTYAADRLQISLPSPSRAEERRIFRIVYQGTPADGLVIDANRHGERTFFGDNWPNRARHWLPTVDHVSDKATVEWLIDAPAHYQVIGTGLLVEETDLPEGRRLTHWSNAVPIAPKVMVMGAARFAVQYLQRVDGVQVQTWVYPQDRDAGFHDFAVAAPILRFFVDRIGPFPYAKLANVQSKTRYGGMENAGNIFYSERSVSGTRRNEGTVAHEIAHQWFGDSVTEADWHHIWLSEGFATYFAQLYTEATYGRDRMVESLQAARQRVVRFFRDNPELAVVAPSIDDLNDLLNANSYQKGGWVLHMLRHRVGDDAFWAGIRAYYRRYRDGNALTEDFRDVMEEAAGQDLDAFFEQWIERPGHPVLEADWSPDAARGVISVTIRQTQPGEPFRFPLDIGLRDAADGPLAVDTVEVTGREQTFAIAVEDQPVELVLDPDTWLLLEEARPPRRR